MACCNVLDGDLHQVDFNAGHWVLKASRRASDGAPALFDIDGKAIEPGDLESLPKRGDLVAMVVQTWAQRKRDRINSTLLAVRLLARNASGGLSAGPGVEKLASLVGGGSLQLKAPAPKALPAKAAPKKKVALRR